MARLPPPPEPAVLAGLLRPDDDIVSLHPASSLIRVFTVAGRHPQQWDSFRRTGPLPHARFDTHPPGPRGRPTDAPGEGVLYFGLSARTCVAEVFQDTSVVDRVTRRPFLVVLRPTRTLRLLDLAGLWPTRAGASQEISSGARERTQEWARSIRAAYPDLDGLWYRSSMDSGNPAVCLWDPPAGGALPASPDALVKLDHPGLDIPLARICAALNYTLLG
ncbi:MAG TPA: RES family NAD+ phosphorylase [Pseudonocardiaceae bacterium]|nr:RES family NAD+ phosphorylase [Pseudonocardiaceae bacterium]